MKTKEVILDGWANMYSDDSISVHKEEVQAKEFGGPLLKHEAVKCKVILEVPVEERSVTITESRFEELWKMVSGNLLVEGEEFFKEQVKEELFGSEG